MKHKSRTEFSASANSSLCTRRRTQSSHYYAKWLTIPVLMLVISILSYTGNVAAQQAQTGSIIASRCMLTNLIQNMSILRTE